MWRWRGVNFPVKQSFSTHGRDSVQLSGEAGVVDGSGQFNLFISSQSKMCRYGVRRV